MHSAATEERQMMPRPDGETIRPERETMTCKVELEGQKITIDAYDFGRVKTLATILYGMTPCDDRRSGRRQHASWALNRAAQLIRQLTEEASRL